MNPEESWWSLYAMWLWGLKLHCMCGKWWIWLLIVVLLKVFQRRWNKGKIVVKCSSRGYRNGRQWVTTSKSLECTKPGSIVNDKLWSRRAAKTGWKCVGSAWLFLRRCILLFPDRHLKPVSRGWHGQHHHHWCLWVIGGSCCRGHISRLSSTTQWSEPKLAWIFCNGWKGFDRTPHRLFCF